MYDVMNIGQFGFYKDSELTEPLVDGQLFDQMDADGTINVWFGGKKLWIPEVGELEIMAKCEQTFLWEIVDENNKRTDEGLDTVFISRAELTEPHYGDLIPLNPEEVFDIYKPELSINRPDEIRASRLWFYNSLFKDQYYRYSVIAMPKTENSINEIDAKILPRNSAIKVPMYHWICGFRPKFEYYSKLSVLKKITSRPEGKIHFQIKIDMKYLYENPGIKRSIRIFSQSDDKVTMLVYQNDPNRVLWRNQRNPYKREFLNYIIFNAISIDLPDDGAFDEADKKYLKFMETSNMILNMDKANYYLLKKDIEAVINNQNRIYNGYSILVMDNFFTWLDYNKKGEFYTKNKSEILNMIVFLKKYYKGFSTLANDLGLTSIKSPYSGPIIEHFAPDQYKTIVTNIGGKEFSNGVREKKCLLYKNNTDNTYLYKGDIGNGYYWINGADGIDRRIWCNMDLDGGGWMLLFMASDTFNAYMENTIKTSEDTKEQFAYDLEKGSSFNVPNDATIDIPWVFYNEIALDMYLENSDVSITIYNSNGLIAKYDCSDSSGIDITYRDETSKRVAFGDVSDNIALPDEQKGLTILIQCNGNVNSRQFFKKIIAR